MSVTTTLRNNNRMTKSDMEASRLVFVYVKDAKPKRKVAVPVPEGLLWQEFLQQVKSKLRLTGVKEIFLASSGHKVSSLDELQDIDELCVVEGPEPVSAPLSTSEAVQRAGSIASTSEIQAANGDTHKQQSYSIPDGHKIAITPGRAASGSHDDQGKYRGRVHPLKRALQKVLPSWFAPTLPITSRDVDASGQAQAGGRRRRGRRSLPNLRNLLLLLAFASCLATMLWFFFRSSAKLANLT